MRAVIFDGKKFAAEKEKILEKEFAALRGKGIVPKLVFILVGENEEAEFYVGLKEKMAKSLGIDFEIKRFGRETAEKTVASYINICSRDAQIAGITFEYPLPADLEKTLPKFLPPEKDIDCLSPENLGRLVLGDYFVLPSTVRAILEVISLTARDALLSRYLRGKPVCLVGWGSLVGRPLAIVLKNLGATLTICDSKTRNLENKTGQAEILISATGIPGLIKKEMVRKGAVVIDAGYPKGDVEPEVIQAASFLTPVPGGLGPVTITSLFENLLELSYRKINNRK